MGDEGTHGFYPNYRKENFIHPNGYWIGQLLLKVNFGFVQSFVKWMEGRYMRFRSQ